MGKPIIVAEKPSVAVDISKVVNSTNTRRDGYIEGDKFLLSWCIGHLTQLCDPEEIDEKYKVWSLDTLPIIPDKLRLKPNPNTIKQYNIVKKLLNSSEVDSVVVATDSAREGQLIWEYL